MTNTAALSERQKFMLDELHALPRGVTMLLDPGSRRIRTARVLESRGLAYLTPRGAEKGFTVHLGQRHPGLSFDDIAEETPHPTPSPTTQVEKAKTRLFDLSEELPELDPVLQFVRDHKDSTGDLILDLSIYIAQQKINHAIVSRAGRG